MKTRQASKPTSSHVLRDVTNALVASAILAGGATATSAHAAWIDTWTASVQPIWAANALPLATDIPDSLTDSTVRQFARVSIGGPRVRIALSNEYGTTPLEIGGVHVAKVAGEKTATDSATDRIALFDGRPTATIEPGARIVSDPLNLPVSALERLAVTLYLPKRTPLTTFHWDGRAHAEVVSGDHLADTRMADPVLLDARLFLSTILVDAPADTRAVVALGDSITDGRGTTIDTDRRWTDDLAQRLSGRGVAVLNAGISGGRLLSEGMGVSARTRFERDVLARPNVKAVVILLGTNDIGWPGSSFAPHDAPMTTAAIVDGFQDLIARAHARGLRVVGGTIAPFEGALEGTDVHGYYTSEKEAVREEVNAWIRRSGAFDAVADFDAALRDPRHPQRLLPAFDVGDYLHPNDAGNAAMARVLTSAILFGE